MAESSKDQPAPRRRAPRYCQPLLLELAGCMNDDVVTELAGRLRKYRNRYAPILRLMVTLVATNMEESAIFGDDVHDGDNIIKNNNNSSSSGGGDGDVSCVVGVKRSRTASSDSGKTTPLSAPADHAALAASAPLLARPLWAVTANKTRPVVRRLHSPFALPSAAAVASSSSLSSPPSASAPSPSSSLSASLMESQRARVVNDLESFMAFDFLPLAATHNRLRAYEQFYNTTSSRDKKMEDGLTTDTTATTATAESPPPFTQHDVSQLVLKQYVHDAARTASFLVADRTSGVAALIDPRVDAVPAYTADLAALGLQLGHVVVTHCFLDCALAVGPLCATHGGVKVWSGVPLHEAGTAHDIPLSSLELDDNTIKARGDPVVMLRTVAVPSFSPENVIVELRLCGVLIAVFCGTAWGTDAAPRSDYFASFTALLTREEARKAGRDGAEQRSVAASATMTRSSSSSTTTTTTNAADPFWIPESFYDQASMRMAQANLKKHWYDAYLYPPAPASTADAAAELEHHLAMDTVIIFPSHGGYSNVTNQLDLFWAMHLHDLKQMQHAKRVIDTLTSPDVYVKFNKRMPPLPRAMLYQANRAFNLRQLLRAQPSTSRNDDGDVAASSMAPPSATPAKPSPPLPPVMLDLRDENAYHAQHIEGAINVPMSFPTNAFGAKRAELWLQCVLVPGQPILALCSDAAQRETVRRRLLSVSPEAAVIAVATLAELTQDSEVIHTASCHGTPTSPTARALPTLPPSCAVSRRTLHVSGAMLGAGGAGGSTNNTAAAGADAGAATAVVVLAPSSLSCATSLSSSSSSGALFPEVVRWVTYSTPLERLWSVESLASIEPRPDTLVIDVRTPYEFKNGSHQHSVHCQLCDLCTDTAADTVRQWRSSQAAAAAAVNGSGQSTSQASATPSFSASPALGGHWVRKLHADGIVAGLSVEREVQRLHQLCFYCAGGYRSLIAESLVIRAVSAAAPESVVESTADGPTTLTSAATSLCWLHTLKLSDVPGGAFQIMTKRPDLWRVKDRSIICIS